MLNPFGRSRQLKEYLFLRSFPKARKTAADIETRALKGLQLQMGGGPRETTGNSAGGGPGHSSEGPFESSDAPEGNQQPEDASGRNNGAAACASPTAPARLIPRKASAAPAEIASAESATAEPAAAAPAGASPVAAAPVEASPSAASLATAAPAAAARRMTLSEAAASVGRQLPLRSSTLQQQHPLGLQSLPTQRVNQLDAVRVNNEIVLLLQDMLLQCTRAAAPWLQQWQQELQLLLHSFLWAVSTARDKPTPGDLLQNVKYYGGEQLHQQQLEQQQQRFQALQQDPTAVPAAVQQQQRVLLHLMLKQQHSLMQRQPLAWKHKLGLLLLHVLLPYFYQLLRQQLHRKRQQQQAAIEQRIRRYNVAQALRRQRMQQQEQQQQQHGEEATEKEQRELCHQLQQRQKQQNLRWPDAAVGNAVTRLTAAERSLEWVYRCFMCIDLLLSLIRFVFFFYFLYRGKHRSVGDWLLGLEMRHIHPSLRRSLSFELLQQQLYWLSVSQVLLLLAPHIDLLLLRRTLRLRLLTPARRAAVASLQQFRLFLRRQRHQQLQQYGTAIEEKGLAAAVAALPFELGQWGLLLLRSTKQQGTKLLQDVGLLPHPLVTKQQQQPGVESGEGRLAVEVSSSSYSAGYFSFLASFLSDFLTV
ncbi:Pex2 / Pex12 amino terminal domain-containing protein, putative [Eimeria maxima]|uniref:RING-type E3 ubiquitin transferase (cysteine targeting) n=1 Tax=Eimeria maxima TaxID=5804 RepID=U6MDF1_EIMMA|nr:Pex2 / Pex12 amino terminal domain-containing protein, putative [Eimeria maxima]CDJ61068.1 Pex2 / Pex12 amino terminal domain-containing protein, putative [Eimeria maxima]